MTDEKPIGKALESGAKLPFGEHLVNVLKAALASAPFAGGIASLMSDYIPNRRHERLEEFAGSLGEELQKLQDNVREDVIHTDEFAHLFEGCFRGAAENYQAEKVAAFRNILPNAATSPPGNAIEREYFLTLVGTLSSLHIRTLHFMARPQSYLRAYDISADRIRGGFSSFFPVAIPGVSLELIKTAFGELYQFGFINTDKSMFGITTSGQGLQLLIGRVTPLGMKFIEFCTRPG
ncbi:MAG: hypothetical protein ACJAW7_002403 [Candidatus Azotimanducaceae bacterium]|jgi:hypothetical protein